MPIEIAGPVEVVEKTVIVEVQNVDNAVRTTEVSKEPRGLQGYSAYDIAVKNGFQGTELEWLDTLTGETVTFEYELSGTEFILSESEIPFKIGSISIFILNPDGKEVSVVTIWKEDRVIIESNLPLDDHKLVIRKIL